MSVVERWLHQIFLPGLATEGNVENLFLSLSLLGLTHNIYTDIHNQENKGILMIKLQKLIIFKTLKLKPVLINLGMDISPHM